MMVNVDDAQLRANRLALLAAAARADEPRRRPVAARRRLTIVRPARRRRIEANARMRYAVEPPGRCCRFRCSRLLQRPSNT
ncbi:MAG: hypothetical protein MZW92_08585 [Comamonadaceae bacterium]|nr:hypothetical protein [Comamonadaceae bacterium]